MANTMQDIQRLQETFQSCRNTLIALGDETRLHLLLIMMNGPCSGLRVVEIAEKTNLSRPAVSHHMQILKNAGIVRTRREGTCIYYYLEPQLEEVEKLICLFQDIGQILRSVPDRSGEEQQEE
ncbi:MAG: ArsR/SmtB family transcription factor [Peptococcaceae bacterium]